MWSSTSSFSTYNLYFSNVCLRINLCTIILLLYICVAIYMYLTCTCTCTWCTSIYLLFQELYYHLCIYCYFNFSWFTPRPDRARCRVNVRRRRCTCTWYTSIYLLFQELYYHLCIYCYFSFSWFPPRPDRARCRVNLRRRRCGPVGVGRRNIWKEQTRQSGH